MHWPFVYLLWITSVQILCSFKKMGYLSFYYWVVIVLYMYLETSPWLIRYIIWKTFLPFVGCLFTVLVVSSAAQQFLILMMYSLSIFVLFLALLVPYLRNTCQIQGHKDLSLCFLLRVFRVLALTFRSFVHIWVKFCRWCKVRGQFHSFACESLFASAPFKIFFLLYIGV